MLQEKKYCSPCKKDISTKNFDKHLNTYTHLKNAIPVVIVTSPEGKSIKYDFQRDNIIECNRTCKWCGFPFYSEYERNTCLKHANKYSRIR